jgi:hypothetical protein
LGLLQEIHRLCGAENFNFSAFAAHADRIGRDENADSADRDERPGKMSSSARLQSGESKEL